MPIPPAQGIYLSGINYIPEQGPGDLNSIPSFGFGDRCNANYTRPLGWGLNVP